MKSVYTDKAPAAIGPYSQAMILNDVLYTSGQIPADPSTGVIVGDTIETQAQQVMENIEAILAEAGTSFDKVVKTTCFLAAPAARQIVLIKERQPDKHGK